MKKHLLIKKKKTGKWLDLVESSVGKFIHFETTDGVHREGKLSGLRTREIEINGKVMNYLTALELNGDPNDFVEFELIRRIVID